MVVHDFGWGVPNAEFLAQFGVEGGKEWFVKVLYCVVFLEAFEEQAGIDAVKGGVGPIEDFDQAEVFEFAGMDNVVKERTDHRDAQEEARLAPIEEIAVGVVGGGRFPNDAGTGLFRGGFQTVPGVNDPRGENAVEKSLDEGGAEEVLALVALKVKAEGVFKRGLEGGEGFKIAGLDAGLGVAGVGGKKSGDILRGLERRVVRQNTGEIFLQARALLPRHFMGMSQSGVKGFFIGGEFEGLKGFGLAIGARTDERECAKIGDEHKTVAIEILADLLALDQRVHIMRGGLYLQDAARGDEIGRRIVAIRHLAELVGGVETAIGNARALAGGINDAGDLRLERPADLVK